MQVISQDTLVVIEPSSGATGGLEFGIERLDLCGHVQRDVRCEHRTRIQEKKLQQPIARRCVRLERLLDTEARSPRLGGHIVGALREHPVKGVSGLGSAQGSQDLNRSPCDVFVLSRRSSDQLADVGALQRRLDGIHGGDPSRVRQTPSVHHGQELGDRSRSRGRVQDQRIRVGVASAQRDNKPRLGLAACHHPKPTTERRRRALGRGPPYTVRLDRATTSVGVGRNLRSLAPVEDANEFRARRAVLTRMQIARRPLSSRCRVRRSPSMWSRCCRRRSGSTPAPARSLPTAPQRWRMPATRRRLGRCCSAYSLGSSPPVPARERAREASGRRARPFLTARYAGRSRNDPARCLVSACRARRSSPT